MKTYKHKKFRLHLGDNIKVLKTYPDNYFDSVVTDAPYGLSKIPDAKEVLKHWLKGDDYEHRGSGFMGKSWDSFVPGPKIWEEVLRVLKPGGHLLCFFGSRTYDLGCMSIRLAGFEIRDEIMWVYGSGFPKSLDVSKALDKKLGAKRKKTGKKIKKVGYAKSNVDHKAQNRTKFEFDEYSKDPVSKQAKHWQGWGTALKPAHEPIVVARKPLSEKTIAENVLKWGVGGFNIDGCRIQTNPEVDDPRLGGKGKFKTDKTAKNIYGGGFAGKDVETSNLGRFPANFIHDDSDEVKSKFPNTGSGNNKGAYNYKGKEYKNKDTSMFNGDKPQAPSNYNDAGTAARFFYGAKANKKDRNEGLDNLTEKPMGFSNKAKSKINKGEKKFDDGKSGMNKITFRANIHPTVKPTDLMQYLVRLVTPKGGKCLDPFMGSGSTGKACMYEGVKFIGIDFEKEYAKIAKHRIIFAYENRKKNAEIK